MLCFFASLIGWPARGAEIFIDRVGTRQLNFSSLTDGSMNNSRNDPVTYFNWYVGYSDTRNPFRWSHQWQPTDASAGSIALDANESFSSILAAELFPVLWDIDYPVSYEYDILYWDSVPYAGGNGTAFSAAANPAAINLGRLEGNNNYWGAKRLALNPALLGPGQTEYFWVQIDQGHSGWLSSIDYVDLSIVFNPGMLSAEKTMTHVSGHNPPRVGHTTWYRVRLTVNNPTHTATGGPMYDVVVNDDFPAGSTIVTPPALGSATLSAAGHLSWNVGIVQDGALDTPPAAGSSAYVDVLVPVTPSIATLGTPYIVNDGATVTGGQTPLDPGDGTGTMYPFVFHSSPGNSSTVTTAIETTPAVAPSYNGSLASTVSISPGQSILVTVNDNDLDANSAVVDTFTLVITNISTGETETIVMTETGTSTKIFTGMLVSQYGAAAGASNNGTLNVKSGDSVRTTYSETANASGAAVTHNSLTTVTGGATGVLTVTSSIVPGGVVSVALSDSDLNVNPVSVNTVSLVFRNTRTNELETILCSETGVNTGLFTATFASVYNAVAGVNNNASMNCVAGDTFTTSYSDGMTATGGTGTVSASVSVLGGANAVFAMTPASIFPGNPLAISLTDADLNTNSGVTETRTVTVTNSNTSETEVVTLTETGVNTGVFTGTLPTVFGLAAGASSDGALSVRAGASVSTIYVDMLNATGGTTSYSASSVVTGGTTGTITSAPSSIVPGMPIAFTLADPDLNTNSVMVESRSLTAVNSTTGESELITLTETGVATGIFFASVNTVFGTSAETANNGTFNVQAGNSVTIQYSDAITITGGTASMSAATVVTGGASGSFTASPTPFTPGTPVLFTIVDADLNTNPANIDTKTVVILNPVTGETAPLTLSETAGNTGVFTAYLSTQYGMVAGVNGDSIINVKAGDSLTSQYNDALNAAGGSAIVTATALVTGGSNSTLTTTTASMTPGQSISFTVTDSDLNTDHAVVNSFLSSVVNVSTGETESVTFSETGVNTGVFSTTIPSAFSAVIGPVDGIIQIKAGQTVRVTYIDMLNSSGGTTTHTVDVNVMGGATAVLSALPVSILPGASIAVSLSDADLNTNSLVMESRTVTVTNSHTGETESLNLVETGVNTGIFQAVLPTVYGTASGVSSDGVMTVRALTAVASTYSDALRADGSSGTVSFTVSISGGYNATLTAGAAVAVPGAPLAFTLTDADLNTNSTAVDNRLLTAQHSATGEIEQLLFTETGSNTGVFTASINTVFGLAAGASNDGKFTVKSTDIITLQYTDSPNSDGGSTILSAQTAITGGTTASLTVSPVSFTPGATVTFTLADGDLNTDGAVSNTFSINVRNTVTNEIEPLLLIETGISTGIFTGAVSTVYGMAAGGGGDGIFNVRAGDTLSAQYSDALTANGGTSVLNVSSTVTGGSNAILTVSHTGIVPGTAISYTLIDADLNTHPGSADTITLTAVSSSGESETLTLTETGASTGIFTGSINTAYSALPGVGGDASFGVSKSDVISLNYTDTLNSSGGTTPHTVTVTVTGGADATFSMLPASIIPGASVTFSLSDNDLNANPLVPDSWAVAVRNSVTGEIENLTLIETGNSTGVFSGILNTVYGTGAGISNNSLMTVRAGSTIISLYYDSLNQDGGTATHTVSTAVTGGSTGLLTAIPSIVAPGVPVSCSVSDSDLNISPSAADTVTVNATNLSTGEIEIVTLVETGVDTGIFTGVLPSVYFDGNGTSNGTIQIKAGQTVRFSYSDMLNASGGTSANNVNISVVGGSNATFSMNPTALLPGVTLAISLTDADLNQDANLSESISITVLNQTNLETETVTLSETGKNTGVFSGTLPTIYGVASGGSGNGALSVRKGDVAKAAYTDVLSFDGGTVIHSVESTITGGSAALFAANRSSIIPGNSITYTLTDSDLNVNPLAVDSKMLTAASGGESENLIFTETGIATGVFTATVNTVFGLAAGAPNDGKFSVQSGNTITIQYADNPNADGGSTVIPVSTTVIGGASAIFEVTPVPVHPGETLTFTLNDPDLDTDPGGIETFDITASNDDTGEVETVTLTETGLGTGIFSGTLASAYDDGSAIPVANDGTIFLKDTDNIISQYSDTLTANGGTALVTVTTNVMGGHDALLSVSPLSITPGTTISYTLSDGDLNIDSGVIDTYSLVLNCSNGDSETLTLTETAIASGIFTVTVGSVYSQGAFAVNDGQLSVRAGETATLEYSDAMDSAGGPATHAVTVAVYGGADASFSVFPVSAIPGTPIAVTLTDNDLNANAGAIDSWSLVFTNLSTGETEDVNLIETSASSGVFTGVLPTAFGVATGTSGNGVMMVEANDSISASYLDSLDSDGGALAHPVTVAITGGTSGSLSSSVSSITPGAAIFYTLTDGDLDTDPAVADILQVIAVNTVSGETESITFSETGVSTGIFEGVLTTAYASSAGPDDDLTLFVMAGQPVRLTYTDTLNDLGGISAHVAEVLVIGGCDSSYDVAPVSILPGSPLVFTLVDNDLDANHFALDSTVLTVMNTVTGESEEIILLETGVNSGVFSHTMDTVYGTSAGPEDGAAITIRRGDFITSSYSDTLTADGGTDIHIATATVTGGTDGSLSANKTSILPGMSITFTLTDPDLNTNPAAADNKLLTAVNAATGESEQMLFIENGPDTGEFYASVNTMFGLVSGAANDGAFSVKAGDSITIAYIDTPTHDGGVGTRIVSIPVTGGNTATFVLVSSSPLPGGMLTFSLADADLDTDPSTHQSVTLTATNTITGEVENITLVETSQHSGMFVKQVQTVYGGVAGVSGDGVFSVKANDAITAQYSDALTSNGGASTNNVSFVIAGGHDASFTVSHSDIVPGTSVSLAIDDFDMNIQPAAIDSFTLSAHCSSGENETVTFTETAVSSGIFSAVVDTVYTSVHDPGGNGVIGVRSGTTITLVYPDAYDALGGPATRTVVIDVHGGNSAALQSWPASVYPGDQVTLTIEDADLDTDPAVAGSWPIEVTNAATGEKESVTLTETAPGSGIFSGALSTVYAAGSGTSYNGVMTVRAGASIETTYIDTLNADGGVTSHYATTVVNGGQSGVISSFPTTIIPGDTVTFQLIDRDIDTDPLALDTIALTLINPGTSETELITLTETGNSTGVFSDTVTTVFSLTAGPSGNDEAVSVFAGNTLTVTYHDILASDGGSSIITASTAVTGGHTASFLSSPAAITPGQSVTFTLREPDFNNDSTVAETHVITAVNTATGETESVTLTETDVDTGIFTGAIATVFGLAAGANDSAIMDIRSGNVITAQYTDHLTSNGGTAAFVTTTPVYGGSDSQLSAIPLAIVPGDAVTFTLMDADLNSNSSIAETIHLTAYNSSTGESETLAMVETSANTGIFTVNVPTVFSLSAGASGDGIFSIRAGAALTMSYTDTLTANGGASVLNAAASVIGGHDSHVDIAPSSLRPGDGLAITLEDGDLDANPLYPDTVDFLVTNTVNGENETITLGETGVSTGIFTAVLPTHFGIASGVADSGTMNVKAGDIVRVSYHDTLTASGGTSSSSAESIVAGGHDAILTCSTYSIIPGQDVSFTITDADMDTDSLAADSFTSPVTQTLSGESEYVTFIETGITTGVFTATVHTRYGTTPDADNTGIINVSAGAALRLDYSDSFTAIGNAVSQSASSAVSGGADSSVSVSPGSVLPGGILQFMVIDADLDADPSSVEHYHFSVINQTTGETEILDFTETGIGTGIFSAAITTVFSVSPGASGDAIVSVKAGDILSFVYNDVLTQDGDTAMRSVAAVITGGADSLLTVLPSDIKPGRSLTLSLSEPDLNTIQFGIDAISIPVVNFTTGETENVKLTETEMDSGVFECVIPTTFGEMPGIDGDGVVSVKSGDMISGAYHDQLNSLGGTDIHTVTATVSGGSDSALTASPTVILPGQGVVFTLTDFDLNKSATSAETIALAISNPGTNETESFTLTETSFDTGVFTVTVPTLFSLIADMPGNGRMFVRSGASLTMTYHDALNDAGGPETHIATVTVTGGASGIISATDTAIPGDMITAMLADSDLDKTPLVETVAIQALNNNTGEEETLILTETSPSSGVFSGTLHTIEGMGTTSGAGADNDGIMPAAGNNTISFIYDDTLTSEGGSTVRTAVTTMYDPGNSVTIVSPIGTFATSTFDITGVTDAYSQVSVKNPITGEVMTSHASATGTYIIYGVKFPEGLNNYSVVSRDPAGNTAAAIAAVRVDTTNSISITTPINESWINVYYTDIIGMTDKDAQITGERIQGSLAMTSQADSGGLFLMQDYPLVAGRNEIVFTSTDSFGNTATAGVVIFADPDISLMLRTPENGRGYNTHQILVEGVTDPGSQATAMHPSTGLPVTVTAGQDGKFSLGVFSFPEGQVAFSVTSTDEAGNTATATVAFYVDTLNTNHISTPPVVTSQYADITGGTDAYSTVTMKHPVTGEILTTRSDHTGAYSFAGVALPDGDYFAATYSVDSLGNKATATISFRVDATIRLSVSMPPNKTVVSDPVLIIFGETDPGSTVTMTNQDTGQVIEVTAGATGTFAIPGAALVEGINNIEILSVDPAGNSIIYEQAINYYPEISLMILSPAYDTVEKKDVLTVSGTTVPGAEVSMAHPLTGQILSVIADDYGNYIFPDVPFHRGRNTFTVTVVDTLGRTTSTYSRFVITELGADAILVVSERTVFNHPIFVDVIDRESYLDAMFVDIVHATVVNPRNGDSEYITLVETGPDTGAFRGHVETRECLSSDGSDSKVLCVVEGDIAVTEHVDQIRSDGTLGTSLSATTLITNDALRILVHAVTVSGGLDKIPLANVEINILSFDATGKFSGDIFSYQTDENGAIPTEFIGRMYGSNSYRIVLPEPFNSIPYNQSSPFTIASIASAPVDASGVKVLEIVLDPAGYVYNILTGTKIDGATVTFHREDGTVVNGPFGLCTNSPSRTQTNPQVTGYCDQPGGFEFVSAESGSDITPGYYYITVSFEGAPQLAESYYPVTRSDAAWSGVHQVYNGEIFRLDQSHQPVGMRIPLMPRLAVSPAVVIEKTADKKVATIGDFITYRITVRNQTQFRSDPNYPVIIDDTLPVTMKFVEGSVSAGKGVSFSAVRTAADRMMILIPSLYGAGDQFGRDKITFYYRGIVNTGAVPGDVIENRAFVSINGSTVSNTAVASVTVVPDPLFDKALLVGRVYEDTNANGIYDKDESGYRGATVVLDDGTSVTTGANGLYSIPAVRPGASFTGTRVAKLDVRTLPAGSVATTEVSQFIRMTAGGIDSADFGFRVPEDATAVAKTEKSLIVASVDLTISEIKSNDSHVSRPNKSEMPDGGNTDGRVAVFYSGRAAKKFKVNLAYDSSKKFSRDEEPIPSAENYYPVTGDDSRVTGTMQSQGKFYMDVTSENSHLAAGYLNAAFDNTSLLDESHPIQGAVYKTSRGRTSDDLKRHNFMLFASRRTNMRANAEYRATGLSSYYLPHTNVIPGSETVKLQSRDRLAPDRIVTATTLQRGVEYETDYVSGEIRFYTPPQQYTDGSSIISSGTETGNPVWVLIEYAYDPTTDDYGVLGARWTARPLRNVLAGTSFLRRTIEGRAVETRGIDLHFAKKGKDILRFEWAGSEDTGVPGYASFDGGKTFTVSRDQDTGRQNAYLADFTLDGSDGLTLQAYYHEVPGGFDGGALSMKGMRRSGGKVGTNFAGGALSLEFTRSATMSGASSLALSHTDGGRSSLTRLGFTNNLKSGRLTTEFINRHPATYSATGTAPRQTDFAYKLERSLTEKTTTYVRQQFTLSGKPRNISALGITKKVSKKMTLASEIIVGKGNAGGSLGLEYRAKPGTRTYFELSNGARFDSDTGGLVLKSGVSGDIGKSAKAYTEYEVGSNNETGQTTRRTAGLSRRFEGAEGLENYITLSRSLEDSDIQGRNISTIVRLTTLFKHSDRQVFSGEFEFKRQRGTTEQDIFGTYMKYTNRIVRGVEGYVEFENRYNKPDTAEVSEYKKIKIIGGLALRQERRNRFTLIARAGRVREYRPTAENREIVPDSTAIVISAEGIYKLNPAFSLRHKTATKFIKETLPPLATAHVRTTLNVTGLTWRLARKWELSAEWRALKQTSYGDKTDGAVVEAGYLMNDTFRFASGYNFSNHSDDEFQLTDYSWKGWFFKMQGKK